MLRAGLFSSCFALMRFAGSVMIRCAKQDALRSFSEGGPVYYVYLIESLSAHEERYVGMTTDLKQRLREHDQGKSSHTKKFSPWKLTTYIAVFPLCEGRICG